MKRRALPDGIADLTLQEHPPRDTSAYLDTPEDAAIQFIKLFHQAVGDHLKT
jgi:hypothetical protein